VALPMRVRAALPLVTRDAPPVPAGAATARGHIRRCTFRRVTPVDRSIPVYDVECLYPSPTGPVPLGDLGTASRICDACTASGVFRPDED
jgi:hypothetical protein